MTNPGSLLSSQLSLSPRPPSHPGHSLSATVVSPTLPSPLTSAASPPLPTQLSAAAFTHPGSFPAAAGLPQGLAPIVVDPSSTAPAIYLALDKNKPSNEERFAKKTAKILSIIQIILGIISILAQSILIMIYYSARHSYAGIGEGIFCGIFFIIAGTLGIVAARKPSTCGISAFMVLSIIASLFSAVLLIMSSIKVFFKLILAAESHITMFSAIMLICAITEGVVAIICSAICCRSCCCNKGGSASQVVYLPGGLPQEGSQNSVMHLNQGYDTNTNLVSATPTVGVAVHEDGLPTYEQISDEGKKPASVSGGYTKIP